MGSVHFHPRFFYICITPLRVDIAFLPHLHCPTLGRLRNRERLRATKRAAHQHKRHVLAAQKPDVAKAFDFNGVVGRSGFGTRYIADNLPFLLAKRFNKQLNSQSVIAKAGKSYDSRIHPSASYTKKPGRNAAGQGLRG